MGKSGITIRYILNRRGGNIEELCDYAKQRGVLLTKKDNYVLSQEELKVLDPLLANEIKRKKIDEAQLLDSLKQKSDRDILIYLFDFWKINEMPNQDGSFKVVASYRYEGKDKNGYDYGYFVDIRNLNGDILYYPFCLEPINIYVSHNENYTKESLWLINVKLSSKKKYRDNNPFLLELSDKIFGKPKNSFVNRLEKEKLIRDLFKKRGATADDAQTIANALNILIDDVRTESERFLFELLQNADDQPYNDTPVNVVFKTLSEHLLVLHNGTPFSPEDVQVISNIGDKSSNKINNREKTGYKGIGFKSVFSDSDTVYIDSGGFSFAFDMNSPVYNSVPDINAIPWQIKPIWQERYRLPEEVAEEQSFFSSRVGIALNAGRNNIVKYKSIIPNLLVDPRFMLFLRHIEEIKYESDCVSIVATKKTYGERVIISNSRNNTEWIVKDFEFEIPAAIKEQMGLEGGNKIPQKLKNATHTKISFAINYIGNKIEKIEKSLLFTYLPTKVDQFKFPFLINADFSVNSSREYVHDDSIWNKFLFEIIGRKTIDWVKNLSDKEDYLNALPTEMDASDLPLFLTYREAYKAALESEAFILNYKGELSRQDEIILDKTGLSRIIGAETFMQLLIGNFKLLPSSSIDTSLLEMNIFEKIEKVEFEVVIDAITDSGIFNDWLINASEEQKKALYKWVRNNNKIRKDTIALFVSKLPLFKFGEQYISRSEIGTFANNQVITTKHIDPIKNILSKLGYVSSDTFFDERHPLFDLVAAQNEVKLYESISKCDFSILNLEERKALFHALKKFDGIEDAKLKGIALFKNMNGNFRPLGKMTMQRSNTPIWLNTFLIDADEYSSEIQPYLIQKECIFQEIVQKHYDNFDNVSFTELYNFYCDQWTPPFTRTLIDKYGATKDLLNIVERTDGTKTYFIEKFGNIYFDNTTTRDSIEYRLIRLALTSKYDIVKLKSIIIVGNRNISEYTINDDVIVSILGKRYHFPLSEIIPNQLVDYSSFNHVKGLLSDLPSADRLFSLSNMNVEDVRKHLKELQKPSQYAFFICYNIANNYKHNITIDDTIFVANVLNYFFEKKIDILGRYIQFFPNQRIKGYFVDADEYTLETERLSSVIRKWADNDDKKRFLISIGAKGRLSDEIKWRKSFLNNEPIFLPHSDISKEISAFLNWCSTLKTPFTQEHQVTVLKDIFNRLKISLSIFIPDYQKVKEWDNRRYHIFVRNKMRIYCMENAMPWRGIYRDKHLFTEYASDYLLLGNKLYVNSTKDIDSILSLVCNDNKISRFNKDDWTNLFMVSVDELKEKDNVIVKKDQLIQSLLEEKQKKEDLINEQNSLIKLYRAKFGELKGVEVEEVDENAAKKTKEDIRSNTKDEMDLQYDKVIERDELSQPEQIAAHKEAEQVVREKLEADGYDCSNWVVEDDDLSTFKKWHSVNQVDNIISPDGERINLVIKSAKGGYIFLSATDFEFLTSNCNNVLMVWDGRNVHSVSAEDIFKKDSNVNLVFDTEYTPKHYYAALSKVFQYIKRTTFAVKCPSYNAYDAIKSFGMDSKTEGVQELFDDNDL